MHIAQDKVKVHSLTGRITMPLLRKSFKAVRKNRGAAGIDKISISMYEENLEENLLSLMKALKTRDAYKPKPLRRTHIPKGKGKTRPLGIPAVRDRVAQEVIRRLLSPIFERRFHDQSYGFRPGRNCHQAIQKVLEYRKEGYRWVVDADIKGFFDNIPHMLIKKSIAARIADGNVLNIVEKFLTAGVMEEGKFRPTTCGTPQGGVISPLLANAVLDHLDWYLQEKGHKFVRYADDFVMLCSSEQQAEKALADAKHILENEMELALSPEKTKIGRVCKGFEFLGFRISSSGVRMRDKSVEKFKTTIRDITQRHLNCDSKVIERLNLVIRGTVNYFHQPFTTVRRQLQALDKWIRMRIRCMLKKRKWYTDNHRIKTQYLARRGLISSYELTKGETQNTIPLQKGQSNRGRPVRESRTPVNIGN